MEWSRRVEYHIFLIYRKLTVQDFNFQLFGILRVSPVRFDGSPSWYLTFYLNLSGRGVNSNFQILAIFQKKKLFLICSGFFYFINLDKNIFFIVVSYE